jgi:DNA-binding CsgD family transcriptional regulator/plasmid stabilization system protein ParE
MALSTCREHGYVRGISRSLGDLADVARDQEDYITALKYYRECLTVLGDRSDIRSVIIALEGTAMAAAFWKQAEQATRLLGAAAGLGEVHKVPTFMSTDLSAHERTVRLVRMTIDETRFEELSAIGSRLTLEEAIAEALAFSPPVEVGSFQLGAGNSTMGLSARESEILRLLAGGLRDREIADRLFISVRTVEGHVGRILSKLGVSSRTAAANVAITHGPSD